MKPQVKPPKRVWSKKRDSLLEWQSNLAEAALQVKAFARELTATQTSLLSIKEASEERAGKALREANNVLRRSVALRRKLVESVGSAAVPEVQRRPKRRGPLSAAVP